MSGGTANIKDIAALAGVSAATVSRAVSRPELVRKATIDRVNDAIDKLGYRPNLTASRLRSKRSRNILVAVPDIHNPFFSGIVRGIENVAQAAGFDVLLGDTRSEQERIDRYADMIQSREADGLILLGALLPRSLRGTGPIPASMDFPLVMACEHFPDLDRPTVMVDNRAAAMTATNLLIGLGHRKIAHMGGPTNNPLCSLRLEGYRAALEAAGIEFRSDFVVNGNFSVSSGYQMMKVLLSQQSLPTAVFAANDEMAIGILRAMDEAHICVPDDMSVIGFDNLRFSEFTNPPLTTIAQPNQEIGEMAMRLMLGCISGEITGGRDIVLSHSLVVRSSTGPVRAT